MPARVQSADEEVFENYNMLPKPVFDCKDIDRLQMLACFPGQMKLLGRAKLSQQKRDMEADQVTYVREPTCPLPPTTRLTGEVLWLLGQESRWGPVNTAL